MSHNVTTADYRKFRRLFVEQVATWRGAGHLPSVRADCRRHRLSVFGLICYRAMERAEGTAAADRWRDNLPARLRRREGVKPPTD